MVPIVSGRAEPHLDKYMGTGSCSSSNCHGGVHPRKGSEILQNEYYTWLKHDKHSQAYTNLTKPEAKRMAGLLNLQDPTKEPLCLKCHATYVPNVAQHGEKFDLEDGVSCESCHGPAERWLSSHAESGASHKDNLDHGLADTYSLEKRATLCLSCHYGNNDKSVTHDLYGAGHPRLSFELDTFGILELKHWVVDDDYLKRKGPYSPIVAWFIGQAHHAREVVNTISNPERSKNGQFPELSLFDCFSCHHNLGEEQWKQRTYQGEPGRLRLNLAPLIMLQETLGAIDVQLASDFRAQVASVHTNYQINGANDALQSLAALLSDRVIPMANRFEPNQATCTTMLRALAHYGAKAPFPKYEVAEQIGMGVQAVLASLPELGKRYESALNQVFSALSAPKPFKPERFTKAMSNLATVVQ